MIEANEFEKSVRRRLDDWGREFRLDRDAEILGHRSKNILAVLIEHKGFMPPRNVGFRPLTIDPQIMQIEDIVRGIYTDFRYLAVVLRAYYCGSGRQGVERRRLAELILGRRIELRAYYAYHDRAFHVVAGALRALAKAA